MTQYWRTSVSLTLFFLLQVISRATAYKRLLLTIKTGYDDVIRELQRREDEVRTAQRTLAALTLHPKSLMACQRRAGQLRERCVCVLVAGVWVAPFTLAPSQCETLGDGEGWNFAPALILIVSGPHYWRTEPVWADKPDSCIRDVLIGPSLTTQSLNTEKCPTKQRYMTKQK